MRVRQVASLDSAAVDGVKRGAQQTLLVPGGFVVGRGLAGRGPVRGRLQDAGCSGRLHRDGGRLPGARGRRAAPPELRPDVLDVDRCCCRRVRSTHCK